MQNKKIEIMLKVEELFNREIAKAPRGLRIKHTIVVAFVTKHDIDLTDRKGVAAMSSLDKVGKGYQGQEDQDRKHASVVE